MPQPDVPRHLQRVYKDAFDKFIDSENTDWIIDVITTVRGSSQCNVTVTHSVVYHSHGEQNHNNDSWSRDTSEAWA